MARPNILMIVSDEERRNDWLDGVVDLPAHRRLREDGLSFNRHFTNASPCSPSRATLYTGRLLADHGVVDNVSFPTHTALDPAIPTVGSLLRDVGYNTGYIGKWHLSHGAEPDLNANGFGGWRGNDKHFTGSAWTGRHFDPIITDHAIDWLEANNASDTAAEEPWFLTVALVNPHDIMWFPIDQPSHQDKDEKLKKIFDFMHDFVLGGEVDVSAPPEDYPRLFDELPPNFHDDLASKPSIQRAWQEVRNTEHFVGSMDLEDTDLWLRQLDYYAWLHQRLDESLARLLGALDQLGIYDETMIVYTSDHGDAAGSHGLRAKLPCVYDEVMGVPLIVKNAQTSAGTTTDALSSHVDIAASVVSAGGGDITAMAGTDLSPVFEDTSASVREAVLFAQDSAQSDRLADVRYALSGFFDGETKYARYYGRGGGIRRDGTVAPGPKQVAADAPFEDMEHEWYDTGTDLHELENRAADPGLRVQTRQLFDRLTALQQTNGI